MCWCTEPRNMVVMCVYYDKYTALTDHLFGEYLPSITFCSTCAVNVFFFKVCQFYFYLLLTC